MSAAEIVSDALLLVGVVLGPAVFGGCAIYCVGKWLGEAIAEYRKQRFLRSLPCGRCRYFSGCEALPCAVNPCVVLSEGAQHCTDFLPAESFSPAVGSVCL